MTVLNTFAEARQTIHGEVNFNSSLLLSPCNSNASGFGPCFTSQHRLVLRSGFAEHDNYKRYTAKLRAGFIDVTSRVTQDGIHIYRPWASTAPSTSHIARHHITATVVELCPLHTPSDIRPQHCTHQL